MKQKRLQPGQYRTIEGYAPTDEIVRSTPVTGALTDKAGKITLRSGLSVGGGGSYVADPKGTQYEATAALQVVDLSYNVRSWLEGINKEGLNASENDLFAMSLDYQENGGYYNGNIRKQHWLSHSAKDAPARSYTYSYDEAGRLTGAVYLGGRAGENYSLSGMLYDKIGNILSLTRNGMRSGSPSAPGFGTIDQLRYDYQGGSSSNKLFSVSDAVSGNAEAGDFRDGNTSGNDYEYYADGSLKQDKNKGITSIVYNSVGLVQTVVLKKKLNGEADPTTCQIDYLFDGSGRKWLKKARTYKELVTSGPLPAPKTHYTYYGQGVQFESDETTGTSNALSHILHEEGRVIKDPQSGQLAYEYHYSDHLGNLRVAFRQQTPVTSQSTLSFEPQNAQAEEAAFERVTGNRAAGIAREGRYAARLLREAGPGKTVRLSEGETLKASVFAYFEQPKHKRTRWLPLPIFDQQQALVDGKAKSKVVLRSGVVLPLKVNRKAKQPEAYLELVVRDTSGSVIHQQRRKITRTAKEQWQELTIHYKAQGAETVEVSLINESSEAAYFDNLTLTQEPPFIVQENHYDPWGLNLAGIEKQGLPNFEFQYNGKEKQEELGLSWLDYGARMYDPQLGRWHVLDPAADAMSSLTPYCYVFNNPLKFTDPTGMIPQTIYDFDGNPHQINDDDVTTVYTSENNSEAKSGGGSNPKDDEKKNPYKTMNEPGGVNEAGLYIAWELRELYNEYFSEEEKKIVTQYGGSPDMLNWVGLGGPLRISISNIIAFIRTGQYTNPFVSSQIIKMFGTGSLSSVSRPPIRLIVGTPEKRGIAHILSRHSDDYFVGAQKGDLFPRGTTLEQIFDGISTVYSKGARVSAPGKAMQTFEHRIKINGESANYRLIVDSVQGDIVSFFKIGS